VPTFLATPRRWRVIAAKAGAAAVTGVVFTAIAVAFLLALAAVLMGGRGVDLAVTGADVRLLSGVVLAGGLWAVIGVGVGAFVRHQVAAVIGPVFWVMFVEELVAGRLGSAAAYLPAKAGMAVLAVWAGVAWLAGSALVVRRDVT
jgi:ABC-type transport system involved in multi-copper enzyme maturation permease subunit